MTLRKLLLPLLMCCTSAVHAAAIDPLTVDIDATDALRFAQLMKNGAIPNAADLQHGYLDGAGLGVRIFTPMRIVDARRLGQNSRGQV